MSIIAGNTANSLLSPMMAFSRKSRKKIGAAGNRFLPNLAAIMLFIFLSAEG